MGIMSRLLFDDLVLELAAHKEMAVSRLRRASDASGLFDRFTTTPLRGKVTATTFSLGLRRSRTAHVRAIGHIQDSTSQGCSVHIRLGPDLRIMALIGAAVGLTAVLGIFLHFFLVGLAVELLGILLNLAILPRQRNRLRDTIVRELTKE